MNRCNHRFSSVNPRGMAVAVASFCMLIILSIMGGKVHGGGLDSLNLDTLPQTAHNDSDSVDNAGSKKKNKPSSLADGASSGKNNAVDTVLVTPDKDSDKSSDVNKKPKKDKKNKSSDGDNVSKDDLAFLDKPSKKSDKPAESAPKDDLAFLDKDPNFLVDKQKKQKQKDVVIPVDSDESKPGLSVPTSLLEQFLNTMEDARTRDMFLSNLKGLVDYEKSQHGSGVLGGGVHFHDAISNLTQSISSFSSQLVAAYTDVSDAIVKPDNPDLIRNVGSQLWQPAVAVLIAFVIQGLIAFLLNAASMPLFRPVPGRPSSLFIDLIPIGVFVGVGFGLSAGFMTLESLRSITVASSLLFAGGFVGLLMLRRGLDADVFAMDPAEKNQLYRSVLILFMLYGVIYITTFICSLDDGLAPLGIALAKILWPIFMVVALLIGLRNRHVVGHVLFDQSTTASRSQLIHQSQIFLSKIWHVAVAAGIVYGVYAWVMDDGMAVAAVTKTIISTVVLILGLRVYTFVLDVVMKSLMAKAVLTETRDYWVNMDYVLHTLGHTFVLIVLTQLWISPVLESFGIQSIDTETILSFGIIAGFALVSWQGLNTFLESQMGSHAGGVADPKSQSRIKTFVPIIRAFLRFMIVFITFVMVMSKIGFNVAPFLAGFGILGIAVGVGAQNLVKDFITGMAILIENDANVGDTIAINGDMTGVIEKMTLRTLHLRDGDGVVHMVPFGSITTLSNKSKDYTQSTVEIPVHGNENLSRVVKILEEIGQAMAQDPQSGYRVVQPPKFLGIKEFRGPVAVLIMSMRTQPDPHHRMALEFRYLVKEAFDKCNIQIIGPEK